MRGRGTNIFWAVALEGVPAVLFGAAAAFCVGKLTGVAALGLMPVGVGAAAAGAAWIPLRLFRGNEPQFPMPRFDPADYEPEVVEAEEPPLLLELPVEDELLLNEPVAEEEELLLEVRAWPESDSRVIRLFDPARMPTAGELQERIDRHLQSPNRVIPDAAQELHDAIAALRQSLR
jgi:hypothetical protein